MNRLIWAGTEADGNPRIIRLPVFGSSALDWSKSRMRHFLRLASFEWDDLDIRNEDSRSGRPNGVSYRHARSLADLRLGSVNCCSRAAKLRENLELTPEHGVGSVAKNANHDNLQDSQNGENRREGREFQWKFCAAPDKLLPATKLGETAESKYGIETRSDYKSGGGKSRICFDFAIRSVAAPQAKRVGEALNFCREKIPIPDLLPILFKSARNAVEVPGHRVSLIRRMREARMLCAFNLVETIRAIAFFNNNWTEATDSRFSPIVAEVQAAPPRLGVCFGVETAR